MMKKILGFFILLISVNCYSARVVNLWDNPTTLKQLNNFVVTNKSATTPTLAAHLGLSTTAAKLGSPNALQVSQVMQSANGIAHIRYDQYYSGVLVWPSHLVYHQSAKQKLLIGNLIEDLTLDIKSVTPQISETAIQQLVLQEAAKAGVKNSRVSFMRLIVYVPTDDDKATTVPAQLAYLINLRGVDHKNNPTALHYVINANTGKTLQHYEGLETASIADIGTGPSGNNVIIPFRAANLYFFGIGGAPVFGKIRVTKNGAQCAMKNEYLELRSWDNALTGDSVFPLLKTQASAHPIFNYPCDNNANDGGFAPINGSISPNNDAMFYATQTFNMLKTFALESDVRKLFGIEGYNNPVILIPHLGDYDNAFALPAREEDGQYNKTFFPQFIIGNGFFDFTALTDALVIAHELGHIVTATGSNLLYFNQSGGINESYSDVQGIALAAYLHKTYSWYTYDWTIGLPISKFVPAIPLRYFYKPSLQAPIFGSSINNASQYTPGMDPHEASGVFNRAFYIFASLFAGNSVPALNDPQLPTNDDAILRAARIFAKANYDLYWLQNSTYSQAACGVMQAALDYEGQSAFRAAKQAFNAVGVRCLAITKMNSLI